MATEAESSLRRQLDGLVACPLFGVEIGGQVWACKGCEARYHPECCWRMATLDEWRAWIGPVMAGADIEADVVRTACREGGV